MSFTNSSNLLEHNKRVVDLLGFWCKILYWTRSAINTSKIILIIYLWQIYGCHWLVLLP